jgi:hypothetical protein
MKTVIIKKLAIPAVVCPVCDRKFIKTSSVVVVKKDIIIHSDYHCWTKYYQDTQNGLPEEQRDRFGMHDFDFRFTSEYEKSDKTTITEGQFNEYKKMFKQVFLPSDPLTVKITLRGRIWDAVGRKYAQQLQMIHALSRVYDKKKDTWRSNFKKTFIPSVLNQFRSKGYLSKKQWDLVDSLLRQEVEGEDKEYFYKEQANAREIENLTLPDRLRYMQRKKSFIKWYNDKNGIPEEE